MPKDTIQYHIGLSKKMIQSAKLVFLPGDPARVLKIAKYLSQAKEIAYKREWRTFLGRLDGVPVIATSSGVGGPAVSICLEELAQLGVETFIRIGTTGAIQREIKLGDIIISNASVRLDGASKCYAPIEYPAVSNFQVTAALISAAERLRLKHHVGITATTDSFYQGQERYDSFTGYVPRHLQGSLKEWQKLNVLNYEMESATLFTLCSAMNLKAGCVCGVIANRTKSEKVASAEKILEVENQTIQTAIEAAKDLI